ncbi:MAG: hypothetical protein LBH98_01985 [Chitinispirillales bacterium]|jgi:hypothetical protein|nr:hypothetical protein [Chitinispirillales bacterium]
MVKKIVIGIMSAGVACAVFATDARVETMGRTDHFFADETSIHQNAANLGLYDKIMYGSYGVYSFVDGKYSSGKPLLPFFGGAVSLGQKENSRSKFSIGVTFNRVDSALNYVMFNVDSLGLRYKKLDKTTDGKVHYAINSSSDAVKYVGNPEKGYNNESRKIDLVGKVDVMLAQTLNNGTTIGLGGYLAFQDSSRSNADGYKNRFVRGNVGVNTPIGDGVNLEASVAFSATTLRGEILSPDNAEKPWFNAADNDIGTHIDVRMFADVASINAAFVPHLQANIIQYACGEEKILDFNAGVGFNLNIDRGFFWTGIEGFYNKATRALVEEKIGGPEAGLYFGNRGVMGGKVGFGIERNVLTDWFVIRVGGGKVLAKEVLADGKKGSRWVENADGDHVSLGMGVNIEDRLKIDFTVSENIPYTFTNLFSNSNESSYVATRVSAVFAF